jgi:hypothetical protein
MEQLLSSGFRPVLRPEAEMWLRLGFIINNSEGIIMLDDICPSENM